MLINHNDEKIRNMVKYFMREVDKICVYKLFKLFYYSDFKHYRETGRSITGMTYKAMEYAPVPDKLLGIMNRKINLPRQAQKFDGKYFSQRELRIIEGVSIFFNSVENKDIVNIPYLTATPWEDTEKGQIIDYKLVLGKGSIDIDEVMAREKYKAEMEIMFS